jgi:cytochrome c-type biogenesis protein
MGTFGFPRRRPQLTYFAVDFDNGPRPAMPQFAASMFVFGLGAPALPLLGNGLLSREALQRWRTRLVAAGQIIKIGFGGLLIVFGALVLTGIDKRVKTALVNASPQWLADLTTRF